MPADSTATPDTAPDPDRASGEAVNGFSIHVHLHRRAADDTTAPEDDTPPLTEADIAILEGLRAELIRRLSTMPMGAIATTIILSCLVRLNFEAPQGDSDDAVLTDLESLLRATPTEGLSPQAVRAILHLVEATRDVVAQQRLIGGANDSLETEG